jgi:NADPH2:quinone reductase
MEGSMSAVVIHEYKDSDNCRVERVEIPQPKKGEVLIKVHASPINPSDIVFLKGKYSIKKVLPAIPGFEGSGEVVASGGGLAAWRLLNKRVVFLAPGDCGAWSEYVITRAKFCIPLPKGISFYEGCSLINPLTVVMFMEHIKQGKHEAVIQTAAASSCGKMLLRWCNAEQIPIINIVRREDQATILRYHGAQYILNSSEPGWEEALRKLCANLHATVAFDAVSGSMTGKLLECMCEDSVVYIYGELGREKVDNIVPASIIFHNKRIEGLMFQAWLRPKGKLGQWNAIKKAASLIPSVLRTDISAKYSLDNIEEAMLFYKKNMSKGKVILTPSEKRDSVDTKS